LLLAAAAWAKGSGRYGERFCNDAAYHCITVGDTVMEREVRTKKGTRIVEKRVSESWSILFPDEREREIVRRVNRMGISLRKGMIVAVPNDMAGKTYMDFSPYPAKMDPELVKTAKAGPARKGKNVPAPETAALEPPPSTGIMQMSLTSSVPGGGEWFDGRESNGDSVDPPVPGEKVLIFDPKLLAWAAYDANGDLVRWGPAAGGKDYCPDVERGCHTRVGTFRVYVKGGPYYRSGKYPVGCGVPDENGRVRACAPMPWFMGFASPGYGFHASANVPGQNASHGCVRLYYEDAEWLNKNFVEIGTRVIVRPY
jgi:hypothetical protein